MIEFDLDIPSLTSNRIQLRYVLWKSFGSVRELHSSSMIDWLIDNEWDADSLDRFIRQRSKKLLKKDEYDTIKRFEDGYGNDSNVFDIDCLKGMKRLEIGNDCFKKVNRFEIDGLNELKSMKIGKTSFYLNEENRKGNNCLIMNCDQLSEIHIGDHSFYWYESFECKNLPSLVSIQLDGKAFMKCQLIVFDSMNDWMNDEWDLIRLQSITMGLFSLGGDGFTRESNELIMKSMNNDDWLIYQIFLLYQWSKEVVTISGI